MTRFLDGPAVGITLYLRRAPVYLRVVKNSDSPTKEASWDALDQLDDQPYSGEQIVVYQLDGEPTWMHVRGRSHSGVYRGGTYRLVDPQPSDDEVRSTSAWRQWVSKQIGQSLNADGTAVTP